MLLDGQPSLKTMRTFILTDLQTGKVPRWGLWLLCALYALPGLVGRDPWRSDDAAGFGVALTMARGGLQDWLTPNVFGQPFSDAGPLAFWLAAATARSLPFLDAHTSVRIAFLALMAGLFVAIWHATWRLARRPGLQPADPFGASASRTDVGRAIADSALLVLLATLGLVARLHETSAHAAQVTWIALFLLGCALALDRPRIGSVLAGLAIAASFLTEGWPQALALAVTVWLLPIASPAWGLVAARFRLTALGTALALSLAWLAALWAFHEGDDQLAPWLARWLTGQAALAGVPTPDNLLYLLRTLPWFLWPAWPVAGWALWRWRHRLSEPAVALPALSLAMLAMPMLAARAGGEEQLLLPLVPAAAMLAAVGLPTLGRGVVNLIDWFAVMTFTLLGVVIWAYWLALLTGTPATMAYKAAQLAPGFAPGWGPVEIGLGMLASIGWLLLVAWRISRQPPMIWRAMALSGGGLVLTWLLLMTLWLPVFNSRNTYRDIAAEAARHLPADHDCVIGTGLSLTERASLAYFGGFRFSPAQAASGSRCHWLVLGPLAGDPAQIDASPLRWQPVWQGSRRRDLEDRLRLFRRISD
jgi:4-amino-4-deoxy-L-arabinose transferase-like glycosyltransferase